MLNIIHGADFHLDSPFSGLSPERAAQRRGEQRDLLTRLAQLAREKQADLVLQCGANEGPLQAGSTTARMAQLFVLDLLFTQVCAKAPERVIENRELVAEAGALKHL